MDTTFADLPAHERWTLKQMLSDKESGKYDDYERLRVAVAARKELLDAAPSKNIMETEVAALREKLQKHAVSNNQSLKEYVDELVACSLLDGLIADKVLGIEY